MTSSDLPRTVTVFDTPHPQVTGLQRTELARTAGLDLAGCNFLTIVHALNEFDLTALGEGRLTHSFETWPAAVQAVLRNELKTFSGRNGGARIEATTQAIGGAPKAFIFGLHWRAK
jgi:hypothetical protein